MGGMMGMVAEGMAFGTGSAIAHRAIGSMFGGGGGGDSAMCRGLHSPTSLAQPETF